MRTGVSRRLGVAALACALTGLVLLAPPAGADATFDQRMLELINQERAAANLAPVVANPGLAGIAASDPYSGCGFPVSGRATDMGVRNYFSHAIAGCGQGVTYMLNATGLVYTAVGENIAWGSGLTDPLVAAANLHSQLMNSPTHRANVLNPDFTAVGVGSWRTSPGQAWSGGGYSLGNVFIVVEVFATVPAPVADDAAVYHPLTPSRILDTRVNTGAWGPLRAGNTMNVQVAGQGGVPVAGVSAVVLNVAVTGSDQASYLTLFPAGGAKPQTSNLNYSAGQTVAVMAITKVGSAGQVAIVNAAGSTQVVADVSGWYDSGLLGLTGARFHAVTPARIVDTRSALGAAGALGAGTTTDVQVAGRGGVPTDASAVVMNVTVTAPTAFSYLSVFPTGEARPIASNLNYDAGQTVPNLVVVKLGTGGRVSVYNASGTTQLIADVAGWYDGNLVNVAGARYHPLLPSRVLDTRAGTGVAPAAPLGSGATMNVQLTGRGGVPASGVSAVVLSVAVTSPTTVGYLTVFPTGAPLPLASNLNFVAGQTVANLVTVGVGTSGQVSVFNAAGATQVVADVAGWYDAG